MAWLGKVATSIFIFIGSVFGFAHQPSAPATPNGQGSGPAQSHLSIDDVMQQMGCRDETACVTACEENDPPPECSQLKALMQEQGSWDAAVRFVDSQKKIVSSFASGSQSSAPAPKPSQSAPDARGFNGEEHAVAYAGDGTSVNAGSLPDCPAGDNGFFDTPPIPLDTLSLIKPLGNMNGGHILPNQADHIYVDTSASSGVSTVYAPGKATLLQVVTQVDQTGLEGDRATIYFSPCKSVMFAYQITAISPALKQAISGLTPIQVQNGGSVMHNTIYQTDIPLESGEALGTFDGELDFAAADIRTPSWQFLDLRTATGMLGDSYLHGVCPLDYFKEPLRTKLRNALSIQNAGVNGIPSCGAIMQDKSGTAQGNWYEQGMDLRNGIVGSGLLAIVHSNRDPAEGAVSFGTALVPSQWMGTQIFFSPTHAGLVNREPSEITADGSAYCFDGPAGAGGTGDEGHLTIEMTSATTLRAEYGAGACPAAPVLSASALDYQR